MNITVRFNADDISSLPEDKPVVYRIFDLYGIIIYVGTAKKGRVRKRLLEHLCGEDLIAEGLTVEIETHLTMESAKTMEYELINRLAPKCNKKRG